MRLLTSLLVLAAVASAQRWQVQRSRLATILFGISFVDESTGFVQGAQDGSGPMILRTIDGGASYQRSSISDGTAMFMAGAAQSRSNAVAGGVGLLTSGIQVTTDGQRFLNADIPVGMPPVGSTQSGAAVRRPGATLGAFGFVGQFTDGARAVTFTRDGGRTWSMHPVGEVPAPVRYGAYPTVDTWYVTGGTWPRRPTREEGSSIVDLTQKVTVNYANDTKRATVQYNMDDAEPTDEDKTGYTAYVLKTIDGGRTFQQVFYNTEGAYYFNGIDCADVNNCLAVTEGLTGARLFGTRDGGATWTERLFIPGRAASLFDVKYVSGGEVWACGGSMDTNFVGQFYHSRDNGMTWTANAVPGVYGTTLSFVTTPRGYVGWATALTIDGQSSTLIYQ